MDLMIYIEFCVHVLSFTLDKNKEVHHFFSVKKKKSVSERDESSFTFPIDPH